MKPYRRIIKWTLVTLAVVLLIRIFLFQSVRVPDFHMASTILPGDRVIVNKFRAGYRFPISLVGFPGASTPYADWFRIPYFRLPALKKLQRQEVIAFNNPAGSDTPLDRKKILISRLVGLPGDTVMVWDKQLHINRKPVPPPVYARAEYRVITNGKAIGDDFLTEFRIEKPRMIADIGIYDFDLSPEAHASIEKHPDVKTIRPTKFYPSDNREGYYPPSSFFRWNRDQYGPLVVPAKGASVSLEIKNVDLYRDIIEVHEGHELIVDFTGVKLDGMLVTEYIFEKDYCFVMDDNRDNPKDSRKIGFIPMDHVLGVSNRVLWNGRKSYDYLKNLQPDRILKRIR